MTYQPINLTTNLTNLNKTYSDLCNLANLAKTFSDLATLQPGQRSLQFPEMAFDNYRITISEFSHISPKTISCGRWLRLPEGEIFGGTQRDHRPCGKIRT
jgi:hypothetical protein